MKFFVMSCGDIVSGAGFLSTPGRLSGWLCGCAASHRAGAWRGLHESPVCSALLKGKSAVDRVLRCGLCRYLRETAMNGRGR